VRYRSRVLKCMHLESYDDALNNITFHNGMAQTSLRFEEHVLSYLLKSETKDSMTLLNVAKLDAPFAYALQQPGYSSSFVVDLPETFNFLIGLRVSRRDVLKNGVSKYLVYRGRAGDRQTVVIWRTTAGWSTKDYEADREFAERERLTEAAEDILVNADSYIPRAKSLDPIFKQLMFS